MVGEQIGHLCELVPGHCWLWIMYYILGMTILPNGNFNPDEIMPICLPSSKNYEDSKRGTSYVYHCYLRGKKLKHYQLFGTLPDPIHVGTKNKETIGYFLTLSPSK